MQRVFVAEPDYYGVRRMWEAGGYEIIKEKEAADIICWTGGQDINPALYGMKPHPSVHFTKSRDDSEISYWAEEPKQLKVGICRGAQLLCALNGGWLYQDVDKHAGGMHDVLYREIDGSVRVSRVSSAHHQMMKPNPNGKSEDWAVASRSTYRDYEEPLRRPVHLDEGYDREIVYWPLTASLGFQGHPEFGDATCTALFHEVVKRAMNCRDSLLYREEMHKKTFGDEPAFVRVIKKKPSNWKSGQVLKFRARDEIEEDDDAPVPAQFIDAEDDDRENGDND